jgi:hypothetical protein
MTMLEGQIDMDLRFIGMGVIVGAGDADLFELAG